MDLLEAIILGIIQGLTEFLPVSSSGHIELGTAILNIQTTDSLLFSIVVHAATALSTILVFRKDILHILDELFQFKWNESTEFVLKIIISIIPIAIVGVFFEDQIEALFGGNVMLVGSMLILTGLLLSFTYFQKSNDGKMTYLSALIVGIAQSIAILPGVSRSGATIATALILGIDRERAARFSFLMVLVPIIGASILKFRDYLQQPTADQGIGGIVLFAGFLAAFVFGYLACKWMLGIVRKGKLIYFAIYCFVVGVISIVTQL